MQIESLLDQAAETWKEASREEGAPVLKLSILRKLSHALHAEKSRALSKRTPEEASLLEALENKIEALKKSTALGSPDLKAVLNEGALPAQPAVQVPDALLEMIPPTKLERYDRQWEQAIFVEAVRARWSFWTLSATLPLAGVEEANRILENTLWPKAVVLFTESIGFSSTHWDGAWTLVCRAPLEPASFCAPAQLLHFSRPTWKLLFSSQHA